jgi:hypothetical protein
MQPLKLPVASMDRMHCAVQDHELRKSNQVENAIIDAAKALCRTVVKGTSRTNFKTSRRNQHTSNKINQVPAKMCVGDP